MIHPIRLPSSTSFRSGATTTTNSTKRARSEIVSDPTDAELADQAPTLYDGGDDVTPAPGAAVPIVEPEVAAADDGTDDSANEPKPRRKRLARLARFVLALGVAAVLILGFAILAAWARSGYFVAFDDDDRVVIYQGRQGSVLWFDPTRESFGPRRDELDTDLILLVEEQPNFSSQASAERFVSERLTPTTEPDE